MNFIFFRRANAAAELINGTQSVTVRLAEISTADKSIFRHEPNGRAARAYGTLVKEVEHIGEKQRIRPADITR